MNPFVVVRMSLIVGILIFARPINRPPANTAPPEGPEKVTVCQLESDPAKYNHKLVEVTGFISHGFEDFGLFDPTCASKDNIWLDYGGTRASNTMYCCGVTPGHTRPQVVSVENLSIPLVDDDRFKEFDKMIRSEYDLMIHATIVGRFFSGEQVRYPGGVFWSGYGHMGCCMLLMIQQVVSVDPHGRDDIDYRASADQPNITKAGCGYAFLREEGQHNDTIELQHKAELGDHPWAFDDPQRVATDALARLLKIEEASMKGIKPKRRTQGRIIYEWQPRTERATYMIVVSRPYVLSFYARDPKKIAWVVIAAYKSSCGKGNSVTLIK